MPELSLTLELMRERTRATEQPRHCAKPADQAIRLFMVRGLPIVDRDILVADAVHGYIEVVYLP